MLQQQIQPGRPFVHRLHRENQIRLARFQGLINEGLPRHRQTVQVQTGNHFRRQVAPEESLRNDRFYQRMAEKPVMGIDRPARVGIVHLSCRGEVGGWDL